MYKVLDVCRHIINYSDDNDYCVSNLKLQKLLYFIQADFLITKDEPCFIENIEAWDFGPVVPEAYHEYCGFACATLPRVNSYLVYDGNGRFGISSVDYKDDEISIEDKKLIDDLLDKMSDYSATYLVEVTHRQTPWKEAYARGRNTVITNNAIRRYFCER